MQSSVAITQQRFLLFALICNACAHAYFLISFPVIARELGFSDAQGGVVMGISALAMTLTAPLWGLICDRIGRRITFLIGLGLTLTLLLAVTWTLYASFIALLGLSLSFNLLLMFRIFGTIGSAAIMPSAQAYIADTTSAAQRTTGMARLGAAFGTGSILGGTLAMLTGIDQLWFGLGVCLLLLLSAWLISLRYLHEPEQKQKCQQKVTTPISHIVKFLLITLCGLATYSLLQQVISLRLQDSFALSADQSLRVGGSAFTGCMLLMVVTQAFIVPRLQKSPLFKLRTGALICCCMLFLSTQDLLPLFIATVICIGLGLGLLLPANLSLISLNSASHQQARNAGINSTFQGLGMTVGPVLGAQLQSVSPDMPWFAASGLMLLVLIFTLSRQGATASGSETPVQKS